jgi:Ca2+/Na+ antiporter
MVIQFAILAASAVVTVLAVRLLVIYGIEAVCRGLRLSTKAQGKIIGYSTSTPELVVIVASACMGVFEAGMWNIAASNIINWVLFLLAVAAYRQHRELFTLQFVDELIFGMISVVLPLVLFATEVKLSVITAAVLLGVFLLYEGLDRALNANKPLEHAVAGVPAGVLKGLFALAVGICLILIAGRFLGSSASQLVRQLGTPAWLIGWILGLITSLPEFASFFEVYRLSRKRDRLHRLEDTQHALDALVSSNMSNLGLILPAGILVYFLCAGG